MVVAAASTLDHHGGAKKKIGSDNRYLSLGTMFFCCIVTPS